MAWNENLQGVALDIARSNDQILRVVAGPGTGKTFALMRRVARLLEEGTIPERILLVTFTRVAARDLETEIARLDVEGADLIKKGTLHSFCFSLLSEDNVLNLTGRNPRMLLGYEERFLLEDMGSGVFGSIDDRKEMLTAFEAAWSREQDQVPGWPLYEFDQEFHNGLLEWLVFHKAMLVGELIPITLRYLRDNPGADVLNQFDHVLIDEYQDLNKAEQSLLDAIGRNSTMTVIGDEDQSIYESLRHAHPEGIMNFHITHNGTSDLPLDECRRCPTRIVTMANSLIRHNNRRSGRVLDQRPGNVEGDIYVIQWPNLEAEVEGIAEFIRDRIQSGLFDPGQTLVLTQRRQLGYMLRDALSDSGIPAHSYFREEILEGNPRDAERCRVQEAFTLLLLLNDPEDHVALRCWLGFGSNNLRTNSYKRLKDYCTHHDISPREALDRIINGEINIPHTQQIVERYLLLRRKAIQLSDIDDREKFNSIFPENAPQFDNIREIVDNSISDDDWQINKLVSVIIINATQPEIPTDVEYVRIMSLQKSKGLSADHVLVTGCIQGLIPSYDDRLSPQQQQRLVEEQRRLFYVAITRTKHTLLLSGSRTLPWHLARRMRAQMGRGVNNEVVQTIASSFIGELGPHAPATTYGPDWEY
jgi:DNA helicase II / ATP-dependent DNA helicase PcrA